MAKNQMIEECKQKVLAGGEITKEEALLLVQQDLEELCAAANEIRQAFCDNAFDICTIINGKSGRCSENCKYCAQSACYTTDIESYPLLSTEEILAEAKKNAEQGVLRYSIVTSGRSLNDEEIDQVCESIREICSQVDIEICASFGLLQKEQLRKLKEAGVTRIHNNLEASARFFPQVCTSHTHEEKVATIHAAHQVGLNVCSGGIMGLGETMEDRIDMAMELRSLGVKSVPVNMLNPIPGTPYEHREHLSMEEMRRIVAIYRFLLPDASIRLAGGRGIMQDKGVSCFQSGANAAISGDMLTTSGITVEKDMQILEELGYEPKLWTK